ncbi:conserved hypothetical protein [Microbacterium sp. 8M]|uniref:M15 family metallopeptidase n=1 Tax=Microbacterium sp. 8M TaxID=2653153 RepID=UPI0012F18EEB|nr:M15 family metallopeptidase [Microbacterium sp. 8M]VXC32336.1 conserved hypothetical protein [Microbacterium sp. 8M]
MTYFVWQDGSRLTPYMAYQIRRLSADMVRLFGVEVLVTSGIRTNQEQIDIFLDTYTPQAYGDGPFGDVRWWQGVRYVRYDPSGTAAPPGESNHEIQGTAGAADLRDTGEDSGIATMGSARSEWLRAHAGDYGMEPEGFSFGEAWHYKFPNIYLPVPAGVSLSEEDDMLDANRDYDAFKTMLQRALKFDVRPNGAGADWKLGPTVWERLNQIQAAASGVTIDPQQVASAIADAVPDDMAKQVADELAKRLQS